MRERANALVAEPSFALGSSIAVGLTGEFFVVELVESKGMLLMVVFKQVQMAQTSHPHHQKQMGGVNRENARQGTPT